MALFADIHMKGIYRSFLLWQSMHEGSAQSVGLNYGQWLCSPQGIKVRVRKEIPGTSQLKSEHFLSAYII